MGALRNIVDGLTNAITGAGGRADPRSYNHYRFGKLGDEQIAAAFDGSWLMRKIITKPAGEMFREGRDWQTSKEQVAKLKAEEKRLGLLQKINQAEILRGLGGAGMVIHVQGDDPTQPLDPSKIKEGSVRLHVWHRSRFTIGGPIGEWDSDWFGHPQFYEIRLATMAGSAPLRFHPSRVVAFPGPASPDTIMCSHEDAWWGRSMVDVVREAVDNVHAGENGFASLIRGAWLRRVYVPKLFERVKTTIDEGFMTRRMEAFALGESSLGATFLDAGDADGKGAEKIEDRQMSWAGIPDIKASNLAVAAAAASIPATVLLEKSPDGMNASGKGDNVNWEKEVKSRQDLHLRPCLDRIDVALIPSALGKVDASVTWLFAPLSTPTEAEEATTFKDLATAITAIQSSALVPDKALAQGVQNLISQRGWLPGLDEALDAIPEDERFPDEANPDSVVDPSAITGRGAVITPQLKEQIRRAANDSRFYDAKPRTLYVSRKVINTAEIAAWAKSQGITDLADDLHVTISYSTTPVDWIKMGADWRDSDGKGNFTIGKGGPRVVEPLGDMAAVLLFASTDLSYRNMSMRDAGASWDWPDYQPHISLTKTPIDLSKVEPYRGEIVLGPEIFEEIVTGEG